MYTLYNFIKDSVVQTKGTETFQAVKLKGTVQPICSAVGVLSWDMQWFSHLLSVCYNFKWGSKMLHHLFWFLSASCKTTCYLNINLPLFIGRFILDTNFPTSDKLFRGAEWHYIDMNKKWRWNKFFTSGVNIFVSSTSANYLSNGILGRNPRRFLHTVEILIKHLTWTVLPYFTLREIFEKTSVSSFTTWAKRKRQ